MKEDDFAVFTYSAFGPGLWIVKILKITNENITIKQISYPEEGNTYYEYFKQADTSLEPGVLREFSSYKGIFEFVLKPSSLTDFAEALAANPNIRLSERDNFVEFIRQKIIEECGEPPARAVEALKEIPLVIDGQVDGFIRINSK